MIKHVHEDAVAGLANIKPGSVQLIWTDPPFNTQKTQKIAGKDHTAYRDARGHDAYKHLILDVAAQAKKVLHPSGSMFVLLDWRYVHDAKVWIDSMFGRKNLRGEIIVFSELGAVSKNRWSQKHTTMLWYTRSDKWVFRSDKVPLVRRKAPKKGYWGVVKKITSVWPYTLSNTAPERVDYPNQKPLEIVKRLIEVHTSKGDLCVDPFAGSGTLGIAAEMLGRNSILIDSSAEAIKVQRARAAALREETSHEV